MSLPPHVVLTDGCPVLVDASGQVHTPRELVRAVYSLADQAGYSQRTQQYTWAVYFLRAADQRRVWLQWLEGTAGS